METGLSREYGVIYCHTRRQHIRNVEFFILTFVLELRVFEDVYWIHLAQQAVN